MEAQREFGENVEYFQERVRRMENATRVVQSESCYHLFKPHSEKKQELQWITCAVQAPRKSPFCPAFNNMTIWFFGWFKACHDYIVTWQFNARGSIIATLSIRYF